MKEGDSVALFKAFSGALTGTLADQWKDIITADIFDEHSALVPGVLMNKNNGHGTNLHGSEGVISNGSKIYVPENTAAVIFNQSGIEEIIVDAGGYEYTNGEASVFNGDGIGRSIFKQTAKRFGFGGIPPIQKKISYVNLREIRGIKFGTQGPQLYHDRFYDTDLEIIAFGTFSIRIIDPAMFLRTFVPANTTSYSFGSPSVRYQIVTEFLQSFSVALNGLSDRYRISQLPSKANEVAAAIINDGQNAGTWPERFGFTIVQAAIENIQFTKESREIVTQYSAKKLDLKAYEDISQTASNISAQQKIAEGIREHGLGNAGGMLFGVNMAQSLGINAERRETMNVDQQIDTLKKLKELLDAGILTEDEFAKKKKDVLGLN